MSEIVYHDETTGVMISTYAGPTRSDGGSRKRVQISRGASGDEDALITFSKEEFFALSEGMRQFSVWQEP